MEYFETIDRGVNEIILLNLVFGLIVGGVLQFIGILLKKQGVASVAIRYYLLTTIVLPVLIALYGYLVIRGFDGFSCLLFSIPIILISSVYYYTHLKK